MPVTLLLIGSLLTTQVSEQHERWLSRLELPYVSVVDMELYFTDQDLQLERFQLGFPEDPEDMVRLAKEELEAGEPPARLLHQASIGFWGLEDREQSWKLLMSSLRAYEQSLEEDPNDFEQHIYFAEALKRAGGLTGKAAFFEKMQEQFAAAAELDGNSAVPGVEAAAVLLKRWSFARRLGEEDANWLREGVESAQQAIDADPSEPGGYWYRFALRFTALSDSELEIPPPERDRQVLEAVAELLEGAEGLEQGDRLLFAAHFVSVAARIRAAEGPAEALAAWGTVDEFVAGMMGHLEPFADDERFSTRAGQTSWMHYSMTSDGEGWEEALARTLALGVEEEQALGIAVYGFEYRGYSELAALLAERLIDVLESDAGRALLVRYLYLTERFADALEAVLEFDERTPETEIQRGILLLRTGERTAARECLEAQRAERGESGPLLHAIGVGLALAGEYEAAVEVLTDAVDLLKENESAALTLAEVEKLATGDRRR